MTKVHQDVGRLAAVAAALLLWPSAAAGAEDGENRDDAIFGGESPAEAATATGAPAKAAAGGEGDFGDDRMATPAKENTELLHRDRTQIGGFFYTRTTGSLGQGQHLSDAGLGNTTLFESYFDSRINDRLRVYTRGRVIYNPLADVPSTSLAIPGMTGAANTDEVRAVLTQMWAKFDIYQRVFVTAGRQFVRWGATRFWNPVDVLNSAKYNPLLFFDERVGPAMIKFHIPVESLGWNFYALVLAENAVKAEQLGLAARGEFVVGPVEIGLTGLARKGFDPKAGLDVSAGVGEFDLTGELSTWRTAAGDIEWYASAGVSWSWAYRDDDSLTLAAEYFHNPQGRTAEQVVAPIVDAANKLLAGQAATMPASTVPLYTGKDYAGVLAAVSSPGSFSDASVTAMVLSNLTDKSGTAQVSLSNRFLTDLGVELYAGASWGTGEFRGYLPMLKTEFAKIPVAASYAERLTAPLLRGGLNLRVDL
ncbi:MAG: hypothetical protein HY902_10490 [Deltaproteobacteria bacterium]|nr:hypothetical protein [Deltaproteobacteria bacterium]